MHTWEFRLLGPLEGWRAGRALALTAAKQRIILTTLLLRSSPTTVPELIEAVWEEPPEGAREAVRSYVMRLRRTCEEHRGELIRTNDSGYQICPEAAKDMSVDLWRFEKLVRHAREARHEGSLAAASQHLHEATGLWSFPLLENVPSPGLHLSQVPQLRERYLGAVEERVEVDLQLGHYEEVLAPLHGLVSEEPLREVFWHQLMTALDAVGRRAEALMHFQLLRDSLVEELGVEPNATLQELHQRLLRADAGPAPRPGPQEDRARPAPPSPRQLPPRTAPFVGRRQLIGEMETMLGTAAPGTGSALVLLTGAAGVGKTGLAVHVAHRSAPAFPDGQLYADMHGFSPLAATCPNTVLLRFLKALGVAADQIPGDLEERAAMFRSLLWERRVLVLLDNVGDRTQVEPLLAGGQGCATLVTSRSDLHGLRAVHGARHLRLEPLEQAESEELLEGMLSLPEGDDEQAGAVQRLARMCDGLPLALRIAGANIGDFPEQRIHSYVAELERSDRLTALRVLGEPDLSVTIAFERSYESLTEQARKLFRLMGLLEGTDLTPASASALLGAEAEEALHSLVRSNLVEQTSATRYRMHDLLRLYAEKLTRQRDGEHERHRALRRFQNFHLAVLRSVSTLVCPDVDLAPPPPGPDPDGTAHLAPHPSDRYQALDWLDTELHNVLTLAHHDFGDPGLAWRVADSLRGLVGLRLRIGELSGPVHTWLERAPDTAEPLGWASMLHIRGLEGIYRQDLPSALADLHASLAHYRRAGWEPGELSVYNNAGVVLAQQGQYREAVEHLGRALAGWRRRGKLPPQRTALGNIAEAHLHLGEPRTAVGVVEMSSVRRDPPEEGAESAPRLVTLGLGRLHLGELNGAELALRHALDISERLGLQRVTAEGLSHLAAVQLAKGRYAAAEASVAQALQTTHDLPRSREHVLALVAAVHTAAARSTGAAVQTGHAALTLSSRTGSPDLQCVALVALAEAEAAEHGPGSATARAQEARDMARAGQMSMLEGRACRTMALDRLRSGDPAGARADAAEAVRIHRELGHRLDAAQALRVLAQVAFEEGNEEQALQAWTRSRQIHRGLGARWRWGRRPVHGAR
ncbi:regulatory protein AfsR [Nocardiopsis kunsanensis]|uniref:Regulatory protein AfsR n=1 Tax=Nocardiopsis kunsanensis TaxID=141693 RepID=A0A918X7X6_9ACTN|nr:BTAD domain-containing putative transcriptional regulator [Nocardiopsis kunsanensis]GHD17560.1 regulatory protein AfsR [Nocardiopsis kunsanensis]